MEDLIIKYLSGNASPEEIGELEAWVLADSKHKKQFMAIKKAWMISGAVEDPNQIDIDRKWTETSQKLFPSTQTLPLSTPNRWPQRLAIAATIVGLIVLGIWLLNRGSSPAENYLASNSTQEVRLADGTQVFLNKNSSISFEQDKENAQRRAKLTGTAFFDVARDKSRPFVISTSTIQVKVLGTSFLVDAREKHSDAEVFVKSGLVRVSVPGKDSIELKAGEGVRYSSTFEKLSKLSEVDPNYLSFTRDSLVFDNAPMDQVAEALSRHFGVDVSIENEALKTCRVNGTYTTESLTDILKLMEVSNGIKFKKEGSGYLISGSCN